MKTRITHAEQQQIAELITDAKQLLAGVEDIERRIALTLGVHSREEDRDAITDAVAGTLTLDVLLDMFNIVVEDEAS